MNNNNFSTMDAKSIINDFLEKFNQSNGAEYHFNILEEQQGNIVENSHTNILMKLLSYKNRFGYIFLQSFCKRFFNGNFQEQEDNINNGNIIFETESPLLNKTKGNGRMDGLIYSKNKFAIIIENKINRAPAGEKQLEKYINNVSINPKIFSQPANSGNPKIISQPENYKNIWVAYLTREGNEKPDEDSCNFLTDEKQFGCDTIDGEITGDRYAALSYSDDILPWLKEALVPIDNIDLYSGLKQYTDYLDRLFRDDYDKKISDEIDKFLMKEIDKYNDVYNKHDILKTLYDNVNERIKKVNEKIKKDGKKDDDDKYKQYNALAKSITRINRGLIENFIKASCEYFEGNYQGKLFSRCYVKCGSGMDFNYVYFTDENWPKTIHFEWLSLSTKLWKEDTTKYNLYFHVEDKKLVKLFTQSKKLESLLEEKFEKVNLQNKISYKKEVDLKIPILSMKYDDLKTALKGVYNEANIGGIVEEVNEILKQNTNTYNIP